MLRTKFIIGALSLLCTGIMKNLTAGDGPVTTCGTINTSASTAIVPVKAVSFSNISSCNLVVLYDPTVATAQSVTAGPGIGGILSSNLEIPGKIRIGWFAENLAITLPDNSVIFNIGFNKVSPGSTTLLFDDDQEGLGCQYYNDIYEPLNDQPASAFYLGGSLVWSSTNDGPVTIAPVIKACPGSGISIPVTVSGFNHIGAVSLRLNYDQSVLTYVSGNNTGGFPGLAFDHSITNTVIIGGNTPATAGYTLSDGAVLFTLNFIYSGGTSSLGWNTDYNSYCEYSGPYPDFNVLNDSPSGSFYINGSVSSDIIITAGTISGTTPLCAGSTAVYTSSGTTGGTWGSTNPAVGMVDPTSGLVTALTAGTTTITYAVNSGCGAPVSSGKLLTVLATLSGGTATTALPQVCYATGTIVTLTGYTGAIRWQQSADGTTGWTSVTGGSGATSAVYTTPGITLPIWYRAKVSGSGCPDVYSTVAGVTVKSCGGVYLKTFLQGAYNPSTHGMRTDLNTGGWLPVTQPYASAKPAYNGTESVTPPFNAAIVDWVVVELRTGIAAGTKVARQAALLMSNGNIVGTDQVNPPAITGITPGNYYVVVYHRNHFPVMTATAVAIPNTSETRYDFTVTPSIGVYGGTNGVIRLETGVYGQVAGDINRDNLLRYSGANNDRGLIFARITAMNTPPVVLNANAHGYFTEDLNMNSWVLYSGAGNDQAIIFAGIDYFTDPTFLVSVYSGVVPVDN